MWALDVTGCLLWHPNIWNIIVLFLLTLVSLSLFFRFDFVIRYAPFQCIHYKCVCLLFRLKVFGDYWPSLQIFNWRFSKLLITKVSVSLRFFPQFDRKAEVVDLVSRNYMAGDGEWISEINENHGIFFSMCQDLFAFQRYRNQLKSWTIISK